MSKQNRNVSLTIGQCIDPSKKERDEMKTEPNDHAFQQTVVQPYKDGKKTVHVTSVTGGLTKREYFAALAMQGLLSDSGSMDFDRMNEKKFASCSIKMADALIKELNKPSQGKEIQ